MKTSPRTFALCAVLALASAIAIATPRPADAQSSWLIRYLSGYDFLPNPPIAEDSTRFVLKGFFPYPCGEIVNANVIDPGHIELTLRPGPACADTGRTWAHVFVLGMLSAGNHTVQITMTVNRPDSGQVVEQGSFEFGVVDSSEAPPPPGPPGFRMGLSISPSRPNVNEPTSINFEGSFPYQCGEANVSLIDPHHIELTLQPGPACSDTTYYWRHRLDLGLLPLGIDSIGVRLTLRSPGMPDSIENGTIVFEVYDNGDPSTAPPDSLHDVMSSARPNPFTDQSQIGVSLEQPTRGELAVYDISGRRVVTIFRGQLPQGTSQFAWNGRRADGSQASRGIYFYRLSIPGRVMSRRVVLLQRP